MHSPPDWAFVKTDRGIPSKGRQSLGRSGWPCSRKILRSLLMLSQDHWCLHTQSESKFGNTFSGMWSSLKSSDETVSSSDETVSVVLKFSSKCSSWLSKCLSKTYCTSSLLSWFKDSSRSLHSKISLSPAWIFLHFLFYSACDIFQINLLYCFFNCFKNKDLVRNFIKFNSKCINVKNASWR